MTDKEVQKLSRNDLLRMLLDAQLENEALIRERTALQEQLAALKRELDEERSKPAPLIRLSEEKTEILPVSQPGLTEEALQQREQRLQQREDRLNALEARQRTLFDAASREVFDRRQQIDSNAAEALIKAEEDARRIRDEAKAFAAQTEQDALDRAELILQRAQEDSNHFWQDVTEQLQKQLADYGVK